MLFLFGDSTQSKAFMAEHSCGVRSKLKAENIMMRWMRGLRGMIMFVMVELEDIDSRDTARQTGGDVAR